MPAVARAARPTVLLAATNPDTILHKALPQRRSAMQLGALPQGSDTGACVDYLLSYVSVDEHDAVLPAPSDPALSPGSQAMLALCESLLHSAEDYLGVADDGAVGADAAGAGAADGGQLGSTGIASRRVNAVVEALVLAEAARVAAEGRLLRRVVSAVRWAFEHTPRNVPVSFVRFWGDRAVDTTAQLEVAYACARLGRRGNGLVDAARALSYDQARFCTFCSASGRAAVDALPLHFLLECALLYDRALFCHIDSGELTFKRAF
jgi:hypothetical protein